jgi:E3 Ubiquitin ligase
VDAAVIDRHLMSMMVVLGVALLVLAGAAAVIALRMWGLWNALRRVRPTTPERLMAAARTGRLDGRVVAVSGTASAGPGGSLRSAVNDMPCVWHRHTVHHRQIHYHTTERGQSQRSSRPRRVADEPSREPFTLSGASARVDVHPDAMRVDRPEAAATRVLPGLATKPFPDPDAMLGATQQMYWHREWIIRPGVPLFVLAEVEGRGARVWLRRPAKGPHVISTRPATTVRRRTALAVLASLLVAPAAAIAGAVVLIVHFV